MLAMQPASKAIHMLLRIDDRILPVQPGGRSFNAVGLPILYHLLEHGELIVCQTLISECLPPALELRLF